MTEENKKSDSLITLFETKKSLTITLLRAREFFNDVISANVSKT